MKPVSRSGRNPRRRRKATDIGSDQVRGWGPHRSRVDFEETERVAGRYAHPIDVMEPEEEEDQTDQVVTSALEMLRKLLFTFFRLPPSMRNVVCHRVTGMTWKQIGLRYSVSLQAAEKKFRAACKIMPELAMMFPKQATGRRKTVGLK